MVGYLRNKRITQKQKWLLNMSFAQPDDIIFLSTCAVNWERLIFGIILYKIFVIIIVHNTEESH